ncbi:hypothetical protein FD755_020666 [Muntiacus reevesi]|uniref:RNase H type-1 domain-containing protein n=1 Tax=Muntiacus reevesi TaxID=9886 RepID=A0A5N3WZN8_MUNRE|nr:hypothetical protein FD755_020666 [Muntiacus reevesi]
MIWAETLPPNTSAQKAELIALIQALEQAKGKRVTIYTDSRYAFSTAHIQGPIYQERGFRTAEGKEVKNLPEIRRLLEAVQLPQAVAIVHVPGHQKGEDLKARGNRAADVAAREAASRDYAAPILAVGFPPPGMGTLPPVPEYSLPDLAWINKDTTFQKDDQDGWYRDQNNNLILPATLGRHLCEHLHTTTHLGEKKTLTLLQTACLKACQLMRAEKKQHSGTRYRGEKPGQHWEIDFTEVDGIGPWVHCNHVRQATPEEQEKARTEWKASPHPSNPLKLKLARRDAS